jgi:hypothetical protein
VKEREREKRKWRGSSESHYNFMEKLRRNIGLRRSQAVPVPPARIGRLERNENSGK